MAFWLTVSPGSPELRVIQLALIGSYALVVIFTPTHPQLSFYLLFAITVAGWLIGVTQEPFIMASWGLYRVTFLSGKSRRLKLITSVVSVGFFLVLVSAQAPSSDFMVLQVLVSVTFLFGAWLMGVQGRAEAEQREQAAESRKRTALLEQRAEVSRELHDILSHTLSRIGMQAAVATEVNSTDLPKVLGVLASIEVDSRLALTEVRSLLVTVKTGVAPATQPTMSSFPDLVRSSAALGIDVDLAMDLPESLPTIVDVNLYRILQELVTNIGKHAAHSQGTIRVGLDSPGLLTVSSESISPGHHDDSNPGIGLDGIRERAEMLGGAADVHREGDLFSVTVTIPLPALPADETHD
ncbi:histidine kinase [Cryobacterium sp. SO2]|uniref:sensor histidine kinase n=1 Tax=Cryobacterium sp. SO2 TaxID=1897060 RepID=UPI00223CC870|nr:histidine kinase [Cryobacterium sp. SO2]WEO78730.1 histidine kinase [Cryobacterium sp. SO2]